jgi:multidrug efflux pump subunit AcrA (membrane-fusion protein)
MNVHAPSSYRGLLDVPPPANTRLVDRRAVWVPLLVAAVLLAGWAAMAPVSGAVIAAARIKVELDRKTVQHREGGIVREIKVRNGQKVRAGDVLVVIDDVRSDAELSLLEDQLRGERVRHARAAAESTLAASFSAATTQSPDSRTRRAPPHARRAALRAAPADGRRPCPVGRARRADRISA